METTARVSDASIALIDGVPKGKYNGVELQSSAGAKQEQGCERDFPSVPPGFYMHSQVSGPRTSRFT